MFDITGCCFIYNLIGDMFLLVFLILQFWLAFKKDAFPNSAAKIVARRNKKSLNHYPTQRN